MVFNFDDMIVREKTNSFKWNARPLGEGEEKLYPMWVADMEFEAAPAIRKRLENRVKEGVFGYELLSEEYYKAVQYWLEKRHRCVAKEECILNCANTMTGLSVILQTYTEVGEAILMNVPAYGNFYHTIQGCGLEIQESRLIEVNNRYTFDLENMEKQVSDNTVAFLLCNPHNPAGTVWSEAELKEICGFCEKHNLFLISDEIQYDFVFEGRHTMAQLAAEPFDIPVITLLSPGKSFNVAGLQTGTLLTNRVGMKQELGGTMDAMAYPVEHAFVEAVTVGAYMESEEWFEAVYQYIRENKRMTVDFINKNIPILHLPESDATYLLWIDCRNLNLTEEELVDFWKNDCRILPSEGREFGDAGKQFVRLNIACSREKLKSILCGIEKGFEKRGFI